MKYDEMEQRLVNLEVAYTESIVGIAQDIGDIRRQQAVGGGLDFGGLATMAMLSGNLFKGSGSTAKNGDLAYPFPTPTPPPVPPVRLANDIALDAVLLQSATAGTGAPTAGSLTKGASVDTGTVTVLTRIANDKNTVRQHRLRVAPAGTAATGTVATVVFPSAIKGTPGIKWSLEGGSGAPHFSVAPTVAADGTTTGYTVSAAVAPSTSVTYDLYIELTAPPA